jgi:DNA-binding XRE family transcriptional regulator
MGSGELQVGGKLYLIPSGKPQSDKQARLERQAAYMAWLLLPKDERVPQTKKAVAELIGVTVQTLFAYERDPDFQLEVKRRLGNVFRVDRLPKVFEALYTTAMEPENPRQVQAARTLLEWFGKGTEESTDLSDLTVEDLEAIASSG